MTPENVAAFGLGVLIVVTGLALGAPAHRISRTLREIASTLRLGVEAQETRHQAQVRREDDAAHRAEQDRLEELAAQERATARTQEDEELVREAHMVKDQNMRLLALVASAIHDDLPAPSALTDPAREGWDMALDRLRRQLKQGLQESRTPTT